jgi:hypothetical protein
MKKALTYRELLENLTAMPPERLDDTATVSVRGVGEFYPVMGMEVLNEDQAQIDPGHLVMVV